MYDTSSKTGTSAAICIISIASAGTSDIHIALESASRDTELKRVKHKSESCYMKNESEGNFDIRVVIDIDR